MAVLEGTVSSVEHIKGTDRDPLQLAAVYFTIDSGTYLQASNAQLLSVATLIGNSRRNGKTITLKSVGLWQLARKASNPAVLMGLKTLAISTNDITFEVTDGSTAGTVDLSTEFANSTAIAVQDVPFGILVGFVES